MTGLPDAYGFTRDSWTDIEKLADTNPRTLAVMHGSSWRGRRLGEAVAG